MQILTRAFIPFIISFLLIAAGCENMEQKKITEEPTAKNSTKTENPAIQDARTPPQPPLKETFDSEPQLSLFPRVGDYQPDSNSDRLPFWKTFIDHFSRVSGLMQEPETKNKVWSFRGIKSIDSVAFFSPVGVEPNTAYHISYKVKVELPENSKTGLGILEFSEFLWIGEQYSEKTMQEYLVNSQPGVEMTESVDWETKEFTLKTSPKTKMIHLVFYREGEHGRKPVLIDDIKIMKAENPL